jgi:hypothetical protein
MEFDGIANQFFAIGFFHEEMRGRCYSREADATSRLVLRCRGSGPRIYSQTATGEIGIPIFTLNHGESHRIGKYKDSVGLGFDRQTAGGCCI